MTMKSVMQEVNEKERRVAASPELEKELKRIPGILIGVLIYSLGINLFLRPLNLYSGGFMGFAQLIDTLLQSHIRLHIPDLSGILYYIMNIPGLILAYRYMSRRFVVKTVLTVTLMTVLLTVIPIPEETILLEPIGNCLIAGIMAGAGIGLVLRMGACDGGMDLIGMILIQTKGNTSVGKANIFCNCILYTICLILFDMQVAIYSLIYSVINSMACDRVHTQNINAQVMIITKVEDVTRLEIEIMGQMHRGLTKWEAKGSYTGDTATILMAVVSKYEVAQLKTIVHGIDPHAFVMIDEDVDVDGHFLKKLT